LPVGGDGFRSEWADPDNRGAAGCVELSSDGSSPRSEMAGLDLPRD
jgi:hypothetical protein